MEMMTTERPGVYSSYTTTKVTGSGSGKKSVGIVARNDLAEPLTVEMISSVEEGQALYGVGSTMAELIEIALVNGALSASCVAVAESVVEVPVELASISDTEDYLAESGEEGLDQDGLEEELDWGTVTETVVDYEAGFALLEVEENLSMILCDSTDLEVHQQLMASVLRASSARKERIGIVACAAGDSVSTCCDHANALNNARMVLVAGKYTGETTGVGYAAGVAGFLAQESDPALPLNGVNLQSVTAMDSNYSDSEVDVLLGAGVLALEQSSAVVSVIRGVTTSTLTDGVKDTTWRDLTTIMVVDEVIPSLRTLLKQKFSRSKNTEMTRGSIRSQVLMELERKLSAEIITEYGDISVEVSTEDAGIAVVSFSFAVAYGLNQIWLTANVQI